jgi:two-component system, cell cycle sensor histidine kinase and response regulator CckA
MTNLRLRLPRRANRDPEPLAQAILEALEGPAAVCDLAGRVVLANRPWRDLVGGVVRLGGEDLYGAFRAARRDGAGEGRLRLPGLERPAQVSLAAPDLFLVRLQELVGVAGERSGGASRAAAIVAAAPFAVALVDGELPFEGQVLDANAAFDRLVGRRAAGSRLGELVTPAGPVADPFTGLLDVTICVRPDDSAQLRLTRAAGAVIVHMADVTEQRAMQDQLAQRNKMEAVGQLAGGVAHDFNNLLSAIRLRVEDLLQGHPLGDPAYESLSEIRATVARAADLVRQLLTFSRKATVKREVLDLAETLGDFEVLLRRLLRENVALAASYDEHLPRVRMDRGQLETAVMNLVVNARDAIGAAAGGRIVLSARRVAAAEAVALGFVGDAPTELAMIEVADNGPGIAPEIRDAIFEPFFTTKPAGEGTGLGLATVYGIVRQAEGWIVADSALGEGARFRVFLPPYVAPLRVETPPPAELRPASRDLSGQGRLLLVEDEALVRGITARLLRARGYEVLEAADGEAALELVKTNAGAIDLMISDVIMPGMDGPALLAAARPFLGGAPVLFVSGYAEAEVSDLLEDQTEVSFLAKPLDIKTLAEEVKRRLEARGHA